MKVWITKYALTDGIQCVDGVTFDRSPKLLEYNRAAGRLSQYAHGEGKEWHRTYESAQARAEAMRVAKIASYRKSIAKLEKLSFSAPMVTREAA
jgi:hypothetical protein